jgi:hypothetical protein
MSYYDQALLSRDQDFTDRVGAAGAVELDVVPGALPPDQWARNSIGWIAAAPGFADAYASALAGGVPDPGRDQAVISDPQILSAVQAHIAATAPPPRP